MIIPFDATQQKSSAKDFSDPIVRKQFLQPSRFLRKAAAIEKYFPHYARALEHIIDRMMADTAGGAR
jgi:hypothetical protein